MCWVLASLLSHETKINPKKFSVASIRQINNLVIRNKITGKLINQNNIYLNYRAKIKYSNLNDSINSLNRNNIDYEMDDKNQIKIISERVRVSSIQHIVFTSSSSVYPKDGKIYSTSDEFVPTNLRAKILLECEQILNNLNNISTITIRLGGIYHGSLIKQSITPRRLVSHKDALKHIEHGINRLGENDCINGFKMS